MGPQTILLVSIVLLIGLAFLFAFTATGGRDEDLAVGSTLADEPPEASDGPAAHASPVLPLALARTGAGRDLERAVALERRRRPAPPARPVPSGVSPLGEEALGVTRRQVLNRGVVTAMGLAIAGFGGSMLAMLWPTLSGGFGARFRVGKVEEILGEVRARKEPFYLGAGRFYVNPYPPEAVPAARKVAAYSAVVGGYGQGLVALYQKCPHLGCRVPWCKTSQWFECPCHGSQYNRVGEKKGGPAPRGMDRFVVTIDAGTILVDTKTIIPGPPIGTNTTGQEAEGPHCIGAAEK